MTGQVHCEHHGTVRFLGNSFCWFLAFLQLPYVCVLAEASEGTSNSGRVTVSSKAAFGQASPGLEKLYSKLGVGNAVTDDETRGADDAQELDEDSDRERQPLDDLGREGRRIEDDYDLSEQEPDNAGRRNNDVEDERERRLALNERRSRMGRERQAPRYSEEVNDGDFERETSRGPAERERWRGRRSRKLRQTSDTEFERSRHPAQYEVVDEAPSLDELNEDDHFRGRGEEEPDSDLVDPDAYVPDRRDRHESDADLVDPDTYVADRRDSLRSDDYDDEERRPQQKRFVSDTPIAVTTTRDPFKFMHGDKVRAFHEGERRLMDAIVKSINDDGTITVTWSSGDTKHCTMRHDSVFRPQDPDPQDAYRLDGPNAFDMAKERKNIAAGTAIGPSKRKTKAEIYDGETLFPPSMLTEEMRSRSRAKHRPSPGHSGMLRSEVVDE